jgi:hypothetical protein
MQLTSECYLVKRERCGDINNSWQFSKKGLYNITCIRQWVALIIILLIAIFPAHNNLLDAEAKYKSLNW